MNLVGYGIMRGAKQVGIWPISWNHARDRVRELSMQFPAHAKEYAIVPVYIGAPISVVLPKEQDSA